VTPAVHYRLQEANCKVRSDKYLSINTLRKGDALSPFLFNLALEYAISRVQAKQEGFKLNGRSACGVNSDMTLLSGDV
jgi:hypothetical protein